jgi:NAD(P)H-dependent flavin oxidoreductase YrpB (nitropropane dioxygenase family)
MKTAVTDLLGIEFPLVAFSHCRDVVAAVSNAGGFGVLGATSFTPDQLDVELAWIDDHVGSRPYGVDVLVPAKLEGKDDDTSGGSLVERVPEAHVKFTKDLLVRYEVIGPGEELPLEERLSESLKPAAAEALLDVAFAHPIRLVANALGPPTPAIVSRAHESGAVVAALVGSVAHATRQVAAGVDLLVAQGYEAGGHTGEITTLVLVPDVVDAVSPVPVLAAGGIASGRQMLAALALGAAGVWTGSLWLTTEEAETNPVVKEKMLAATASDTVRSRARTGKPARQLRTAWHQEWESASSPGPLPMPLMGMISEPAMRRVGDAAVAGRPGARQLATYFVGQAVGRMNAVKPARRVVYEMIEELADAMASLEERVEG